MDIDLEFENWRHQWQSAPAETLTDLSSRVHHQVRMVWFGFAMSLLVTIGFGIGIPAWAISSGRFDVAVLAAGVWVMLLVAWSTSIALGRGTWRPSASTTSAFLDYAILSCRRRRQSIGAAAMLYAVFLTFVMTWKYFDRTTPPPDVWTFLTTGFNLVVWEVTLALAALALWRRRALQRELRNLLELAKDLRHSA